MNRDVVLGRMGVAGWAPQQEQGSLEVARMVTIRKARVEDAPALANLWHEMVTFHARRGDYWRVRRGSKRSFHNHIADMIAEGTSGVFVAEDEGQPIGFVVAQVASRARCFVQKEHGLICDLAVAEPYRRRGVGEKLFCRAMRWIRDKGLGIAEVRVATANAVATSFWEKMGFEAYMMLLKKDLSPPTESKRKHGQRA